MTMVVSAYPNDTDKQTIKTKTLSKFFNIFYLLSFSYYYCREEYRWQ